MSSSFGTLLKTTTFGESHGRAVGAVLDGLPAGLSLDEADIQAQLDRRRPGQSVLTTERGETDQVRLLSGVENGRTLGTPIAMRVENRDQRPADYGEMDTVPRPSHADYTYRVKYGIAARSGGGRASARETIGRVAAGAVADKWLLETFGIEIVAWVDAVGDITAPVPEIGTLSRRRVDAHPVRCPDDATAGAMSDLITAVRTARDSVGGIVACVCRNVPAGLGEPIFDKFEALLAHAMLSIPATKGFEVGAGFNAARMRGSAHNDPFIFRNGVLETTTNHSGGIQGGISNGAPVVFRVAFKPPATIGLPQQTVDYRGRPVTLEARGRHDPCVVPRAVPIVEAMAALVIGDLLLRQHGRRR
ncbi:MAG: chorismate synthase [Desulfobacteraceae bacterium]|nr:chorismate synthase [Desulfobacteraceae bacterium]